MGCDIHLYVEYRKPRSEKWLSGDYFKQDDEQEEMAYEVVELYGDRNYTLFATLAGVRDYSEEIRPVSKPKGLPGDVSAYVKQQSDRWDGDGHTHSWLTLKELIDYQTANPTTVYSGLLSPEQLSEFEMGIMPTHWCQGTSSKGYERRTWSEPSTVLLPLIEKVARRGYELFCPYGGTYDEANDSNIRIVFWFDN